MKKTGKLILALVLSFSMLLVIVMPCFAVQNAPFAESAFYTQGDYSIHYRVLPAVGEEIGQIFMIHGMISSTVYWEPLAKILNEKGYRCVLADLPDFGYSTRESGEITAIAREALMAGLMQELALSEKWIVAGHSMGGGVALQIAVQYPELVESLLLYAPAGSSGGTNTMPNFMTRIFGYLLNCAAQILPRIEPIVRLLFLQASSESWTYAKQYDLSRITDSLLLPSTGSGLLYMAQHTTALDLEAVAQLEIPILLVWGEKDRVVTADGSINLQNALQQANAQEKWVASGHMFAETQAEITGELTLQFLLKESH